MIKHPDNYKNILGGDAGQETTCMGTGTPFHHLPGRKFTENVDESKNFRFLYKTLEFYA